jgi:pimeloyl-ACP methyl ester carboxylesterase
MFTRFRNTIYALLLAGLTTSSCQSWAGIAVTPSVSLPPTIVPTATATTISIPTFSPTPEATVLDTITPIPTPSLEPASLTPAYPDCEDRPEMIQQICTSSVAGLQFWAYKTSEALPMPQSGLPLLVYLHGFSQSGSDLDRLLDSGIPAEIEKGRTLPLMAVSPQCPAGENWQTPQMVEKISQFVAELVEVYQLDPERVYLTGFSMGGDGVWAVGSAHPEQFAALVPVASDWFARDPSELCVLMNTPIWVFQSEEDEVVSPRYARSNVAAIQQCGGTNIRLTVFSNGGHDKTSREVYAMDEMYQWLLEQK